MHCPDCQSAQLPGAIYCDECGAYLLPYAGKEGPPGEEAPFATGKEVTSEPALIGQALDLGEGAEQLVLVIPHSGRRLTVKLRKELTIGRADPDSAWQPDVDLTPDSGSDRGVSRRHATLSRSHQGMVLSDNSRNGTFLNGYRLPPDLPYPVRSGDEIRFGELLVHLFIE